jgi:hypothetical protein
MCKCGCGILAPRDKRGRPNYYVRGHFMLKKGRIRGTGGYIYLKLPFHPRAKKDGYVLEHLVIAEHALGRYILPPIQIHHMNQQPGDNRNRNLVICEDDGYHKLLHQRTRAWKESGHADWRACHICKKFSPLHHLKMNGPRTGLNIYHALCASMRNRQYYLNAKALHAQAEQEAQT